MGKTEKVKVPVTKSNMPALDTYMRQIGTLWDSHHLTNFGEQHGRLEAALKDYLQTPNLTLTCNGHMALEAILDAFGLEEGEVITTPFTFISTTHALVRRGLTPVFCDVKAEDGTMDPACIEALITDKTCAIMPVHIYGHACDVAAIDQIGKAHGLKVIYDAAQAFGVRVRGQGIGSFGDATMFSFHATKVFHTIEGGAVASGDEALTHRIRRMINFGFEQGEVTWVGFNGKMNEFQAAMGLCNLPMVDAHIDLRRVLIDGYRERLKGVPGLTLFETQGDVRANNAYLPVLVTGGFEARERLYEKLMAAGIGSRRYFYPLTCDAACYKETYGQTALPVARMLANQVLTLPVYSDMTLSMVNEICDIVTK